MAGNENFLVEVYPPSWKPPSPPPPRRRFWAYNEITTFVQLIVRINAISSTLDVQVAKCVYVDCSTIKKERIIAYPRRTERMKFVQLFSGACDSYSTALPTSTFCFGSSQSASGSQLSNIIFYLYLFRKPSRVFSRREYFVYADISTKRR